MRKLKLRFIIPDNDEPKVVGKLFEEFVKLGEAGNGFVISDKKLNMSFMFTDPNEKLVTMMSELPYQYVEYLTVEEAEEVVDEEESDPKGKQNIEEDGKDAEDTVIPGQITVTEILEAKEAEEAASSETHDKEPEPNASKEKEVEAKPKAPAKQPKEKRTRFKAPEEIDEVGAEVFKNEAEKSGSFDEFVENVGKYIGINETYHEFFDALVASACNVGKVNIAAISVDMERNGVLFNPSKRIGISEKVREAFEKIGSNVRFVTFLREVIKYKDYNFNGESKEALKEDGFKIFYKELVEAARSSENPEFSDRVGVILDRIKTKNDKSFYEANRDNLIQFVTRTAEDIVAGKEFRDVFNARSEEIFESSSHLARAFIYQSVKDYCTLIGYGESSIVESFFEDVSKLM